MGLRGTCGGLTGPIDRAGRACGDGLSVLKHLELPYCYSYIGKRKRQRRKAKGFVFVPMMS